MRFKRSTPRYSNTPVPETPYQAAQQQWDERIGSARVQRRIGVGWPSGVWHSPVRWRAPHLAIGPIHRDPVCGGGRFPGMFRSVGAVDEHYRPTDAQIAHHLERFIRNVRSIPLDPIVLRQNWLEAYDSVSPRAAAMVE